MIEDAISRLKAHLTDLPERFSEFTEEEVSTPPAPGKWSRKEVLGHLIDSACNNHNRFVKSMFEDEPIKLVKYAQDDWVRSQNYRDEDTKVILDLWKSYNTHILHIFTIFPEDRLNIKWDINGEMFTAEWLITDYVDHMEHHLNQIFK